MKISLQEFENILSWDTEGKYCIDVRFSIDGCEKHERVYLGKIPDTDYPEVDIYWLRLVLDGGSEYLFHSKEELFTVKAFDGKSLEDLWIKLRSVKYAVVARRTASEHMWYKSYTL